MRGIDATTGKVLDGAAHVKQSIKDILTTRIGTRIMRRDYGSRLPELVDNPINEMLKVELYAETAAALAKWEPRFKLERVMLESASTSGKIILTLYGKIVINNQPVTIEGIEIT